MLQCCRKNTLCNIYLVHTERAFERGCAFFLECPSLINRCLGDQDHFETQALLNHISLPLSEETIEELDRKTFGYVLLAPEVTEYTKLPENCPEYP